MKTFRKHRIGWGIAFLGLLAALFFFTFKDLRPETTGFEKAVRSAAHEVRGVALIDRSSLARENWAKKWNEIHLLLQVPPGSPAPVFWERIKKKIPRKYHLRREVITRTGRSNFIRAEYQIHGISFGFIELVSSRRAVSTEFLEEEQETVAPQGPLEFLKKFAPKPAPRFEKKIGRPQVRPPVVPAPAKPGPALLAFVIDDVGNSRDVAELLFSIRAPLTVAILPRLRYSRFYGERARQAGYEILLHQPVEALHHNDELGPGAIFTNQSSQTIRDIVTENLRSLPGVNGSNNHMGSRGTQSEHLMVNYLGALKGAGFFYLDSYTVKDSIGSEAASSLGVPYLRRSVFLDNEDDPPAIRRQVEEAVRLARSQGRAVAIGHARSNTLKVLREMIPEIEK